MADACSIKGLFSDIPPRTDAESAARGTSSEDASGVRPHPEGGAPGHPEDAPTAAPKAPPESEIEWLDPQAAFAVDPIDEAFDALIAMEEKAVADRPLPPPPRVPRVEPPAPATQAWQPEPLAASHPAYADHSPPGEDRFDLEKVVSETAPPALRAPVPLLESCEPDHGANGRKGLMRAVALAVLATSIIGVAGYFALRAKPSAPRETEVDSLAPGVTTRGAELESPEPEIATGGVAASLGRRRHSEADVGPVGGPGAEREAEAPAASDPAGLPSRGQRRRARDDAQPRSGPSLESGRAPRETRSSPPLAAQPTRAQVREALEAVRGDVRECALGASSRSAVRVRVTVAPSGRVTTALVTGHLAGTPYGSCIARAVRRARLPAFTGEWLVVEYPYRL